MPATATGTRIHPNRLRMVAHSVNLSPQLSDDGTCSEWQDDLQFRPICRYWPFNPIDLEEFPGCGFSFVLAPAEEEEKNEEE